MFPRPSETCHDSRTTTSSWQPIFAGVFLAFGLMLTGCGGSAVDSSSADVASLVELPAEDELRDRLDRVLQFTFDERQLSLEDHAAWQILHGVLTYQDEFVVLHHGEPVGAVEHLLNGGAMQGWTVQSIPNATTGRPGLRAVLEAGSKTGQGHPDQWFAVLAQCGLPPEQTIRVGDQELTMQDFVSQVLADIPRNLQREYSWTLIGLTHYLPTDHTWEAHGETWSIAQLVEIEAEQELASSACGGSHRLIGMSMALNQHLSQQGAVTGAWSKADARIQQAIARAKELQNEDGTFSTNYFLRPGRSPDLAQNLGATGHTLEFLVLSMTEEQLTEPWVERAVVALCEIFEKTRKVPLECGALYHAAHGLALYRQRRFGEKSYSQASP